MKRFITIATAAALLLALFALPACGGNGYNNEPIGNPPPHPWVFVHGLNGFGEDSGMPAVYWGGTAGDLLAELRTEGFTIHAPTVSPSGSARDRAAELFAQLTGSQVDYGHAHAYRHEMDRFGTVYYPPMIPGWGTPDHNGHLRKVNLVGHSFGGNTIRALAGLLLHGCADERAHAAATGEEISPLFVGGKADWVHSITTVATPHNGVSLLVMLDVNPLLSAVAEALPQSQIDQAMRALGIYIPGVTSFVDFLNASQGANNAFADLTLPGAEALNAITPPAPNTFYFSFAVDGTDNGRPIAAEMAAPSRLLGMQIGNFTYPAGGITAAWRANDGLVNTISATRPFNQPHVNVPTHMALTQVLPGQWYVMPTVRGDHGSVIGLGRTMDDILPMYLEHLRMVDELVAR
ncbi:MAG: hypothetical protein FWB76_08055 [Oscillospiraceae bacterium]|nr:hypothetical protein [Oscillospiraceae bacterium]